MSAREVRWWRVLRAVGGAVIAARGEGLVLWRLVVVQGWIG